MSAISDFDFGPDVDPTHDPVYGPETYQANRASDTVDEESTGSSGEGNAAAGSSSANVRDELPPADRAWHLFCQGMTYTAIARELKIDRHTVARYVKQIHDETQADRRADRSLALTQALGALAQIQAKAWEQIARDESHERVVWDLYVRAAAQAADQAHALAGGYTVRPPTFHARTARLLTIILAAIREAARLELLYTEQAPARDGDAPSDEDKDHHLYVMMRRSDQDALAQLRQQRAAGGPDTDESAAPSPADASDTPHTECDAADVADPSAADRSAPASADATVPALDIRDANGNVPIPHTHPQPDPRPDGTDDWYVYSSTPLSPPGTLPPRPGQPPRRRHSQRAQ